MKILVGAYAPGEGEVRIGDNPVHFNHPLEAQHAGVAIIYQEFNLLPDRSVAENIKVKRGLRRLRGKLRVTLLVEMSGAEREVSDSLKLTLVGRKKRR